MTDPTTTERHVTRQEYRDAAALYAAAAELFDREEAASVAALFGGWALRQPVDTDDIDRVAGACGRIRLELYGW